MLHEVSAELAQVEPWTAEATEQAVRAFAERKGAKLGAVAQPLRAALDRPHDVAGHFRSADRARQGGEPCPHRRPNQARKRHTARGLIREQFCGSVAQVCCSQACDSFLIQRWIG